MSRLARVTAPPWKSARSSGARPAPGRVASSGMRRTDSASAAAARPAPAAPAAPAAPVASGSRTPVLGAWFTAATPFPSELGRAGGGAAGTVPIPAGGAAGGSARAASGPAGAGAAQGAGTSAGAGASGASGGCCLASGSISLRADNRAVISPWSLPMPGQLCTSGAALQHMQALVHPPPSCNCLLDQVRGGRQEQARHAKPL